MHRIYNRHMIAKVSGCSISTVARVIMAMEVLASRADVDIGDMIPQGLASAMPANDNVTAVVEQGFKEVKASLSVLMADDDAGQIRLVRDTKSMLYSGHDDAAIEDEQNLGKRTRKHRA